jgi:hypothetical protein
MTRNLYRPQFDPNHVNDWFPVYGEMAGSRFHPQRMGWYVWSNPNPYPGLEEPVNIIKVGAPNGREYRIDLLRFRRDGQFQEIYVDGQLLPVQIGWYKGGIHRGYDRNGKWVKFRVSAGYYGLWT